MNLIKTTLATALLSVVASTANAEFSQLPMWIELEEFNPGTRTYQGYKVEECKHFHGVVDFCTNEAMKGMVAIANNKKPLMAGKYKVAIVDGLKLNDFGEKVSGFALIDTKAKKIITAPFEFLQGTRVTYNTKGQNTVYVYGDVSSVLNSNGIGNETTPVTITYDPAEKTFFAKGIQYW
ncbi:hypothetical protein B0181_04805 [Moraxella caviae]|uniref:Uncharacterized protein n=1 Tax=Moraxella caviae TaxID=34060 RepID=A0A1T0A3M9_9GAMM|nr:hypothetical protein [Moraxella caviae]OOR90198.1 hypothetical protein B0181_04805 [Moraxella caviae]STZ14584.1 Uncharacterised protein [Moraxella caviae]VEW11353.1 Uncharacterised protein [Moraxella caviae]